MAGTRQRSVERRARPGIDDGLPAGAGRGCQQDDRRDEPGSRVPWSAGDAERLSAAGVRESAFPIAPHWSRNTLGASSTRPYSARRASVGLTLAARRAGRKLAAKDAEPRTRATPAKVAASQACTPNRSLPIAIDAPTAHTRPMLIPARVSHPACRITIL